MALRCLGIFENACKSKKTFRNYKLYLDNFLEWAHKDYGALLMLPQIELEESLQDYCIFLKKRADNDEMNPNSIPFFFNGIFKFLKVNRKTVDRELIKQLYPEKKKLGGELAITTEQVKILLDSTGLKRDKALIHVSSATGARPEAVCLLQLKNIEPYKDGFLKLVLYFEDYKHEMVTFLHPEASRALTEYFEWRRSKGEKLTSESFVFRVNCYDSLHLKSKPMTLSTIENIMLRIWNNSGIQRIKKGNRFDLASFTCFRKRFDTILEFNPEVSMGATQYLMDHAGYMSGNHYRRPTVEQIFDSYKKASIQLMISDEFRLKEELRCKESQISNIENQKDQKIEFLEQRLAGVERLLLKLHVKFTQ